MIIEDRIDRMGETVNDLHDELQYAESQEEADRINRHIDTLNKRIKKMAEDNNIKLYDSWKGIDWIMAKLYGRFRNEKQTLSDTLKEEMMYSIWNVMTDMEIIGMTKNEIKRIISRDFKLYVNAYFSSISESGYWIMAREEFTPDLSLILIDNKLCIRERFYYLPNSDNNDGCAEKITVIE